MTRAQSKHPDEIRTFGLFNFVNKLPAGQTLTGSPTLVGGGLTIAFFSLIGTVVNVTLSVGTLGTTYGTTCRMATTGGETLELDALISVDAKYIERRSKWRKQPAEVKLITFNFAPKLFTGATLTGAATVDAVDPAAAVGITFSAPTVGASTVTAFVSSGESRGLYVGDCRCGATNGDFLVIPFHLHVKDD